jgi:hypothetical protein
MIRTFRDRLDKIIKPDQQWTELVFPILLTYNNKLVHSSIDFTPKYSNSYLIIEYQTNYSLAGNGDDAAFGFLKVNDVRISQTYQKWVATTAGGGGTRSGVLFPLIGRYTNENTTTKTIDVDLYNGTVGDPITVSSDISTWLKITEIGR